jgi:hypothetical protein
MKVAKFEIKMILALVLSRYEYNLVDASGKPSKQLPQPDRNDIHQVCRLHVFQTQLIVYLGETDGRTVLPSVQENRCIGSAVVILREYYCRQSLLDKSQFQVIKCIIYRVQVNHISVMRCAGHEPAVLASRSNSSWLGD